MDPAVAISGQPRTKLAKSPIGSSFPHTFTDQTGREVEEIYVIQPDRSLRIAERHYRLCLPGTVTGNSAVVVEARQSRRRAEEFHRRPARLPRKGGFYSNCVAIRPDTSFK